MKGAYLSQMDERDAGTTNDPHSSNAKLRKPILAVFLLVLGALISSMYVFYRSSYLRAAGDWRWFWGGEVFIGGWLVFGVAQALRKKLKP